MDQRQRTTCWACALMATVLSFLATFSAQAQNYKLRGTVADGTSGETLIGASVILKGTTIGSVTDIDGKFEINVAELPPYTLVISFIGYTQQEIVVESLDKELKFKLSTDQVLLKEAEVVGSRISDKQKQAPLTVESMDVIAIREAPSGDFYESLGNLKGVDMTAASMGFKVINTRGFNSTSPVRSLQLIDGVDNQSPGLNFSLGNFLGASDLDVMKVDIIAGASSAYFGPGAFNGVVNMTTKSPWLFPGLSVSAKAGERSLGEFAVRYAQKFKNPDGTKDRFAYKLNAFAFTANDWEAHNYDATSNSPTRATNPGGYDAVNIYGDEDVSFNNNFTSSITDLTTYPGLGKFIRNGYREADLVDYDTKNFKLGGSLHYMIADSIEAKVGSNFSTGSTVYQGDNRYRLKDVKFFQHQLQVGKKDKWFVRAYMTHEDAGKTYDIFTTGVRLQEAAGGTKEWNTQYTNYWGNVIADLVEDHPDYITVSEAVTDSMWNQQQWRAYYAQWLVENNEFLQGLHQQATDHTNQVSAQSVVPFYAPGTDRFNEKIDEITTKRFTDGGSLFFDRSKLYHVMGEHRFKPKFAEILVGANFRQYSPNSAGTIFRDTGNVVIKNSEYGAFVGLEKWFGGKRFKATTTVRMDKNENFKALFSPALSLIYLPAEQHTVRFSLSSAIRNPTLADQYLYYNVGRAILLGNVDGQFEAGNDSIFTVASFSKYRQSLNRSDLDYFNVDRLRPEKALTIEAGYRGTLTEKFYLDAGAYQTWYNDFIGYVIGIDGEFDQLSGFPLGLQVYRLAANSTQQVQTRGANIGLNYYRKYVTYAWNYSWNKLVSGDDDPVIPAFNTPENKFNVSMTGHDMKAPFGEKRVFGFGVNYKYVQGFTFEGSPQFTGDLPSYDNVDVQMNMKIPTVNLIVKVGAKNLFGIVPLFDPEVPSSERLDRAINNDTYLVFGGPRVGRLAYLQIIYELNKR